MRVHQYAFIVETRGMAPAWGRPVWIVSTAWTPGPEQGFDVESDEFHRLVVSESSLTPAHHRRCAVWVDCHSKCTCKRERSDDLQALDECEGCDRLFNGGVRQYAVVHHDGTTSSPHWCVDCFELAELDFNGETKSCVPIPDSDAPAPVPTADRCPTCGAIASIEGGPVTIEGARAFQEANCSACGAVFTNVFCLDRQEVSDE